MTGGGSGGAKAFERKGRKELPQRSRRLLGGFVAWIVCVFFTSHALAQVTFERLVHSSKEPQNWMTYSGDYSGKRFSGLDQVNITNARPLLATGVYQTGPPR